MRAARVFLVAVALTAVRPAFAGPALSELEAVLGAERVASLPVRRLEDVIAALSAPQRSEAKTRLDRLSPAGWPAPAREELAQAYRLLANAPSVAGAALLSRAEQRLAAHDYAGAEALALQALALDRHDRRALSVLHAAKGRGSAVKDASKAPAAGVQFASAGVAPDGRPVKLAVKVGPTKAPPALAVPSQEGLAYLGPGAERPSAWKKVYWNMKALASFNYHETTPQEAAKLEAVKRALDSTETGARLVMELGGWDNIHRMVDLKFADAGADNVNGYARPLMSVDAAGRRYALVLNTSRLVDPDEALAPILAHELSHIRDFEAQGSIGNGLALPSEYIAHRVQVYTFLELQARMSEERRNEMLNNPRWNYQQFIADLWQDRIQERFPSQQDFIDRFPGGDIPKRAKRAYEDLHNSVVRPGSPHLDFHLNAEETGVYTVLTDEKDIVDLIAQRQKSGKYRPEQQARDQATLQRRTMMLLDSDERDDDYRKRHGFQLGASQ